MANKIIHAIISNVGTLSNPIPLLNLSPTTLEVSPEDQVYLLVDNHWSNEVEGTLTVQLSSSRDLDHYLKNIASSVTINSPSPLCQIRTNNVPITGPITEEFDYTLELIYNNPLGSNKITFAEDPKMRINPKRN